MESISLEQLKHISLKGNTPLFDNFKEASSSLREVLFQLPVSKQSLSFGMSVTSLCWRKFDFSFFVNEEEEQNHPSVSQWNKNLLLDNYHMIAVLNGEAFLRTYDFQGIISSNNLVIIPPKEKFCITPNLNKDYEEISISFEGYIPENWTKKEFFPKLIAPVKIKEIENFISAFKSIIVLIKKDIPGIQPVVCSHIINIFAEIVFCNNNFSFSSTQHKEPIDIVRTYFEEHIYSKFNIEDMCDSLNMNYYQLRIYFKQKTGFTPYQYLLDLKIIYAIKLLETTKLSVKEISYKLAFDSQYYFSRLFKKKTGVSPSKWVDNKKTL